MSRDVTQMSRRCHAVDIDTDLETEKEQGLIDYVSISGQVPVDNSDLIHPIGYDVDYDTLRAREVADAISNRDAYWREIEEAAEADERRAEIRSYTEMGHI